MTDDSDLDRTLSALPGRPAHGPARATTERLACARLRDATRHGRGWRLARLTIGPAMLPLALAGAVGLYLGWAIRVLLLVRR